MTREALKLALELIERVNRGGWILADFEDEMYTAITAIREALAQPEQSNEAAIRADEREACAKVCDEVGEHPSLQPRHCAEAIRARGQA